MKAALIHSFGGIEKISVEEVSVASPGPNEVQIAVHYAGVNPVDWKIAEGMLKTRMDYQFPLILGWDAAGKISATGSEVTSFKVGDPVFAYCRKGIMRDGAFAEFICLPTENVALKPPSLSFAEASVIPLSSLTAWQSLFEAAHLQSKETILIHAGAGGVGGFAIQLAKFAGAYVITTASPKNRDYVKLLGADEVIDYTKESFLKQLQIKYPHGVDVVYDTVGEETLKMSYAATKEGGRLITIAGSIDPVLAAERQLQTEFVFVRPHHQQLQKIAELIESGSLTVPRVQEFSFQDIEAALRKSRSGHVQGKMALQIH